MSLFNPSIATMWHWGEGEFAEKTQIVQMDLTSDQMAEVERLTSVISIPLSTDSPEPGVSFQNLGEHDFEGIPAKGTRIITIHAVPGSSSSTQTIHEVWFSSEMRLVLRVVDGDPAGKETVSGLAHISLTPDASLFEPPPNRIARHWKESSQYAAPDLEALTLWAVK
ncbi:hypothetical protein D1Y84_14760 [Acidipila sp. EB88]|nr:hypothetical protein D1Y84_14760 [Acidipila sp. EB88]